MITKEKIVSNLSKAVIGNKLARNIIIKLIEKILYKRAVEKEAKQSFEKKYKKKPPLFITLSPTKRCNLSCIGCYASSTSATAETLDWSIVDKIMTELHGEMGMRFFVISGGEPMMYKSNGNSILDLPRKYKDSFFFDVYKWNSDYRI